MSIFSRGNFVMVTILCLNDFLAFSLRLRNYATIVTRALLLPEIVVVEPLFRISFYFSFHFSCKVFKHV